MTSHYCRYCDYTTKNKSNYNKHVKSTKHIKNFATIRYKSRVVQIAHKNDKYICTLCKIIFTRKYHLKRHQMLHCKRSIDNVSQQSILKLQVDDKVSKKDNINVLGVCAHSSQGKPCEIQGKPCEIQNKISNYNKNRYIKRNDTLTLHKLTKIDLQVLDTLREFNLLDKYNAGKEYPFCKKMFTRKDNFGVHIGKCSKKDVYLEKYKTLMAKREAEKYKNESNKITHALVNNTNKKSISKITQISNDYPNAEPLRLLDYSNYLDNVGITYNNEKPHQDFEEQFLEEVLSACMNGSVEVTLSEAIINIYKTIKPKDQSIWCTDTARMRYVVMKYIDEINKDWISDPKGKYIQSKIIDPIVKNIQELCDKYIKRFYWNRYIKWLKNAFPDEPDKHVPDWEYEHRFLRYELYANELIKKIKGQKIQKKMLEYMAKHFCFIINNKVCDKNNV